MSGRLSTGLVGFATLSFEIDHARGVSFVLFLVRNWCDIVPIAGANVSRALVLLFGGEVLSRASPGQALNSAMLRNVMVGESSPSQSQ